jgi:hypothetical protein
MTGRCRSGVIVEVIAFFTDNDQTGEPVEAYYGTVQALPR